MGGAVVGAEAAVAEPAGGGFDDQPAGDAPAADGEDVLAVQVATGAHAQFAQDAAVEVDDEVRMGGIQVAAREEVGEVGGEHASVIGHRLELAGAGLLAGGAEVITLDEQQLQDGAPTGLDVRGGGFHLQARRRRGGAGGHQAPTGPHHAHPATAVGGEFRVVTEVGDIDPRRQSGVHDGLAGGEGDRLAIDPELVEGRHIASRWAPASVRPLMARATERAPSRSKAGV